MPKFRKRPVVIEAVLWDGSIRSIEAIGILDEGGVINTALSRNELEIVTLEGVMTARQGDWVIKGVRGELYPCKPDIFEATYEPVAEKAEAA